MLANLNCRDPHRLVSGSKIEFKATGHVVYLYSECFRTKVVQLCRIGTPGLFSPLACYGFLFTRARQNVGLPTDSHFSNLISHRGQVILPPETRWKFENRGTDRVTLLHFFFFNVKRIFISQLYPHPHPRVNILFLKICLCNGYKKTINSLIPKLLIGANSRLVTQVNILNI